MSRSDLGPDIAEATPEALIRGKRDGRRLSATGIERFIAGIGTGETSPEQAAAFLMAAFLRGLDRSETVALTRAMTASGRQLRWEGLHGPVLDKHSTGGIGDNVSLVLAPAVAACGGYVPMISGRGLGHTGGTLDKLASIPGYDVQPSLDRLRATVAQVGCAIIGQTADLAPADRTLYAIRDVTATVESIPLITASILSKKLAAGLDGLVMDIKTGSGAFMPTLDEARALARSLCAVAQGAGLPTRALITDMDQPLASAAGNALEVRHAVDHLTGRKRDERLDDVVVALGAEMLLLGRLASDGGAARTRIEVALTSGAAAERFGAMVAALGGPPDVLERPETYLPEAPVRLSIMAERPGFVASIDARAIGLAVVALGGGRRKPTDTIDPLVGLSDLARLGSKTDRPLAIVHARTEPAALEAAEALRRAYRIAEDQPTSRHPVLVRAAEIEADDQ
jgi:thymidine phosphorylase